MAILRSLAREFKLRRDARFYSTDTSKKLEGKVAAITGGASGIGKATAGEFVRHGARVMIVDNDPDRGHQTAKELGPTCQFLPCDVTVEAQVAEAVETILSRHGKLDIMYNNAGTSGHTTPTSIPELDLRAFERVMQINVTGMVAGIKHAARAMIPAGSGCILCTSSTAGLMGGLGPHLYSISKFAVTGMVKSLASELCRHGVRINCISPSAIPTPLAMGYFRGIFPRASDEQIREAVNGIEDLKGAKCEEIDVAKAALYLASDDAKYITGHNLVVDGGCTSFRSISVTLPS